MHLPFSLQSCKFSCTFRPIINLQYNPMPLQDVDEKLLYDTFSAFGVIVTNPKVTFLLLCSEWVSEWVFLASCLDLWNREPNLLTANFTVLISIETSSLSVTEHLLCFYCFSLIIYFWVVFQLSSFGTTKFQLSFFSLSWLIHKVFSNKKEQEKIICLQLMLLIGWSIENFGWYLM